MPSRETSFTNTSISIQVVIKKKSQVVNKKKLRLNVYFIFLVVEKRTDWMTIDISQLIDSMSILVVPAH